MTFCTEMQIKFKKKKKVMLRLKRKRSVSKGSGSGDSSDNDEFGAFQEFYKDWQRDDDKPLFRCQQWIGERQTASKDKILCLAVQRPRTNGREGTWRYFVASTFERLVKVYGALLAHERTWHEVVTRNQPCNLFFDFEFEQEHVTPAQVAQGNRAIGALLDSVWTLLVEHADVTLDSVEALRQRSHVTHLQSHKANKFSVHLIVQMEAIAFVDSANCGRFVRAAVAHCLQKLHGAERTEPELADLLRRMVDYDVYHANHSLRMYMSTKVGEERFLRTVDEQRANRTTIDCEVLRRSLVTLIDSGANPHDRKRPLLLLQWRAAALMSPPIAHGNDCDVWTDASASASVSGEEMAAEAALVSYGQFSECNVPSEVARILLHAFRRFEAYAVQWNETSLRFLVSTKNKQCPVAGREHKSNHVYFTVDLMRMCFYVQCHDTACKQMLRRRKQRGQTLDDNVRILLEQWMVDHWQPPTINLCLLFRDT